jgi:hypothetical protein
LHYGFSEVVEVDMSEAEEVVAAEAPDARHRRFFVFVLFFFFLPSFPAPGPNTDPYLGFADSTSFEI